MTTPVAPGGGGVDGAGVPVDEASAAPSGTTTPTPPIVLDNAAIVTQFAQFQQMMLDLDARLQALTANTGNAVQGLSQQAQAGFQKADEAQDAAKAAAAAKPASVPIRIPQPQRFKGVREGPKVLEWAHQATTYLRAAGIEDSPAGMWHITNFFDADAAVWWRLQCDRYDRGEAFAPADWRQLKEMLIKQFQIFNHVTDVRDQYHALRQTGSVSAYITRFRALVVELPDETESHQIYQFLKGLKPEIQARTRTHKPASLGEAMDIADEADRANYHAYRGTTSHRANVPRTGGHSSSGPAPMQLGAVGDFDLDVAAMQPAQLIPPHELQRLRQENRCFYCCKVGHAARDCNKKKLDSKKQGKSRTTRKVGNGKA